MGNIDYKLRRTPAVAAAATSRCESRSDEEEGAPGCMTNVLMAKLNCFLFIYFCTFFVHLLYCFSFLTILAYPFSNAFHCFVMYESTRGGC